MTNEQKIKIFLQYFNDFLSVKGIAEYYDMPENDMLSIITQGKELHETKFRKV